ncbi:MAG: glycosyltransferase family 2 protein [Clostridia bacterium]|jgi:cellulose synthase/poly-beta-1,6-N-acetylglucosamine synthase-like glycosyltransferase|nr:glycosyltransferase family 2 protein [Clostridia bacterium]
MRSSIPRLGDILVEKGRLNERNLQRALVYQQKHGGLLGNILVAFGWAEEADIRAARKQIPSKGKLGEMLVEYGALTQTQLNTALEFQQKSGGPLGEILLSLGLVDEPTLYKAIAAQQETGRLGAELSLNASVRIPEEIALQFQAIAVHENPHRIAVAVVKPLSPEKLQLLEEVLQRKVEQVLATSAELETLWGRVYADELLSISTEKLARERPDLSARISFTPPQKTGLLLVLLTVTLGLVLNWFVTVLTINIVIQILYFIVAFFKFLMILRGIRSGAQIRITEKEVAALDERELRIYTILAPMYKESCVIPQLIANLEQLDYPKHKLDIRLLIEEDDVEAQELVQAMNLPPYYTTLIVPHSLPKTKPKACNYGLINARGDYVVIYDAEDRPDPDQLKKVHLAFRRSPDSCCCMQAKLNYYNSEQNLLTRWFTQEYSMWFDLLLPGLMQLNIPIPLGGTSNHFKIEALKKVLAWDPYNVTEDADLGIRLYGAGYSTAIVNSRTWEEANSRTRNWIRQRSRWIKGYMQTWLVHMRHPLRLWRQVGARGFLGIQVIVLATPLLPLINPLLWALVILWYATYHGFIPLLFPGPVYYMAAAELLLGNFLFIFGNIVGTYWVVQELQEKGNDALSFRLVKYGLFSPLYWLLMSIAAYKAAWQLITRPFYWEKTEHGLLVSEAA